MHRNRSLCISRRTFVSRAWDTRANRLAIRFVNLNEKGLPRRWTVLKLICGADPLVRGRPPGRLHQSSEILWSPVTADEGVGRGPGGPPHKSDCPVNSWTLH